MTAFDEAIKKIGWDVIESDGPDDRAWRQVIAKFADKGYARVLCTGEDDITLVLEFAHPHVAPDLVCETLGDEWKVAGHILQSPLRDDPFETLIHLDKVAALIASDSDDVIAELRALTSEESGVVSGDSDEGSDDTNGFEEIGDDEPDDQADDAVADAEFIEDDDEKSEEKEADEDHDETSDASDEKLDAEANTKPESAFARDVHRTTSHIDVALGFGHAMTAPTYGRLEETLTRNLRAKFDVTARVVTKPQSDAHVEAGFEHSLYLRVIPDETGNHAMQRAFDNVTEYFDKLLELSRLGIDPLVFLGVSMSRASGAFKAPTIESLPVDEPDDDEPDEVVLSLGGSHDALKPGSFEDNRLREPDATSALVDVVLRHPGYSDRNMSQVLSLLLSIEYHQALDIIERAPCIVAWSVARERALTMKTVIEGAGGKIHLAEPGTFDVD